MQLQHDTDTSLRRFIDRALNETIYHVWYEAVSTYSTRHLTFSFDKLPALAGIASRIHDITKDDYLAGHWRRELERSLFWRVETESGCGHPGRVKEYRAPSWSWASVNADTVANIPHLYDGETPTTMEIIDASVDVDGENPFGCVRSASIVIKADVIRASWRAGLNSWRVQYAGDAYGDTQFHDLLITSSDDIVIGVWRYDDVVCGVLPGFPLTENTPYEEIQKRSVPKGYFGSVYSSDIQVHGADVHDDSTLWKRAANVPEDLLLVKGRTTSQYKGDDIYTMITDVLVLARTEGLEGEYRRVGVGNLATWNNDVASSEVLTVV